MFATGVNWIAPVVVLTTAAPKEGRGWATMAITTLGPKAIGAPLSVSLASTLIDTAVSSLVVATSLPATGTPPPPPLPRAVFTSRDATPPWGDKTLTLDGGAASGATVRLGKPVRVRVGTLIWSLDDAVTARLPPFA